MYNQAIYYVTHYFVNHNRLIMMDIQPIEGITSYVDKFVRGIIGISNSSKMAAVSNTKLSHSIHPTQNTCHTTSVSNYNEGVSTTIRHMTNSSSESNWFKTSYINTLNLKVNLPKSNSVESMYTMPAISMSSLPPLHVNSSIIQPISHSLSHGLLPCNGRENALSNSRTTNMFEYQSIDSNRSEDVSLHTCYTTSMEVVNPMHLSGGTVVIRSSDSFEYSPAYIGFKHRLARSGTKWR